jgi:hypothetical protein
LLVVEEVLLMEVVVPVGIRQERLLSLDHHQPLFKLVVELQVAVLPLLNLLEVEILTLELQ